MTSWFPDTCGGGRDQCEVEISDDQSSPQWGEAIRHISVCSLHRTAVMDHLAVHAENRLKNRALNDILTAHPEQTKLVQWSFDGLRVLTFATNSLSQAEISNLQNLLDTRYGPGKIKVR